MICAVCDEWQSGQCADQVFSLLRQGGTLDAATLRACQSLGSSLVHCAGSVADHHHVGRADACPQTAVLQVPW
jgi:hypothetical protein